MFDWLKNMLFTPKRHEILDLRLCVDSLTARLHALETKAGIEEKREVRGQKEARKKEAMVKALAAFQGGNTEALKQIAMEYPDVVQDLVGQIL